LSSGVGRMAYMGPPPKTGNLPVAHRLESGRALKATTGGGMGFPGLGARGGHKKHWKCRLEEDAHVAHTSPTCVPLSAWLGAKTQSGCSVNFDFLPFRPASSRTETSRFSHSGRSKFRGEEPSRGGGSLQNAAQPGRRGPRLAGRSWQKAAQTSSS